jgi:hypothetical protein
MLQMSQGMLLLLPPLLPAAAAAAAAARSLLPLFSFSRVASLRGTITIQLYMDDRE